MGAPTVTAMHGLTGYTETERPKGDFYATPEIAVRNLMAVETFGHDILEPCCGNGAISEVLKSYGKKVTSRDLHNWGYGEPDRDFINSEVDGAFDAVITNPPFVLFQQFSEKALEYVKERKGKVAMLGRVQALEGIKRRPLFENGPLKKVWVFSRRLPRMHRYDYEGKTATSMIAFSWFIWDFNHKGEPTVGWI